MKKSSRSVEKVTFNFQAEPGKDIFVAGTFNDWQPGKIRLRDNGAGEYTATLKLAAERHEYKFVVDDVWRMDPQNPESVCNDCGSMNNVIIVA